MARTLLVGDPVVTLSDPSSGEPDLRADSAVVVDGRRIVEIGDRETLLARGDHDRVLGSPGHFVMPGMLNCHHHSELAIGPGLYQFIFERANTTLVRPTGGVDEDDLQAVLTWGIVQAIKGGQTGAIDFYYGRPGVAHHAAEVALRAYEDAGFRAAFGLVTRDQNIYVHAPDEQFLARLPADLAAEVRATTMGYAWPVDEIHASFRELAGRWHGHHDRIRLILAPDWTPACSDELYRTSRALADEYDTTIATHALETRSEMMYSLETHGMSAVERLDRLGVLGPDVSLAHFVWATDDDIARVADAGAVAACNPGSNLRLSTGVCRVRDLMDAGGRVAFGTDGISFSDREDFFQELRLGAYLQRTPTRFEVGRVDSEQLMRGATTNAAQAMGWGGELGRIEPGHLADLLVIRKDRLVFPPRRFDMTPFLDVVVDRTDASDIDHVLINGEVVMEDGEITVVDEVALRERVIAASERLYELGASTQTTQISARVDPYVVDFYQRWYDVPLEAASVYNVRRQPDDDGPRPGTEG